MKLRVVGQSIRYTDPNFTVSGSSNVYKVEFEFNDIKGLPSWESLNKFAIFKNTSVDEYPEGLPVEIIDGEVEIPTIIVSKVGRLYIGVYGTSDEVTMPTIWAPSLNVYEGVVKAEVEEFGALAYKDSASGVYTPSGSVSAPVFTGTEMTLSTNITPSGSVSVTENTTTVNSITDVGALPSITTEVDGETLVVRFSAGSLPTKGQDQTVISGVSASFSGNQETISLSATPEGSVSAPDFTGELATITVE